MAIATDHLESRLDDSYQFLDCFVVIKLLNFIVSSNFSVMGIHPLLKTFLVIYMSYLARQIVKLIVRSIDA